MSEPLSFEGKKYISAKDAAALTGYTSDYVGQLARSGKVHSQLVGRARFVDRGELLAYIEVNKKTKKEKVVVAEKEDAVKKSPKKAPEQIPEITKVTKKKNQEFFNKLQQKKTSRSQIVSAHNVGNQKTPSGLQGVRAHSMLLSQMTLFLFILAFSVSMYVVVVGTQSLVKENSREIHTASVTTQVTKFVDATAEWLVDTFSRFAFIRSGKSEVVVSDTSVQKKEPLSQIKKEQEGIVVLPSTGDEKLDADIVVKVQESFSDEVVVVPNEGGRSGLVTPVFKEKVGQSFLYVLVPMEEEDESSQP